MSGFSGKWIGGPHNTTITIHVSLAGELEGSYRCPSGTLAEFSGRLHRGTFARCLWVDPDVPGAAQRNSEQTLELQLNPSGTSWTGEATVASGAVVHWTAVKVLPKPREPGERLSTVGVCKDPQIFQRLTRPKSAQSLDSARQLNLGASLKTSASCRNGLLLDMAPLCISDPFEDPAGTTPAPRTGRSMLSGAMKSGRAGPGTSFSAVPALGLGDPYEIPSKRLFKAKREAEIAALAVSGFKDRRAFRVPVAQPINDGTRYLSEIDSDAPKELLRQAVSKASLERVRSRASVERVLPPRNFVTNPSKKGGPGTPGVLLSHKSKATLSIVTYVDDPFSPSKLKAEVRAGHEAEVAACLLRPPFKYRAHVDPDATFESNEHTFKGLGPGGVIRPSSAPVRPKRAPSAEPATDPAAGGAHVSAPAPVPEAAPPFRPPYKHKLEGTFDAFPPHLPDPLPQKVYTKPVLTSEPVAKWRPSSPPKSWPSSSIITHRSNIMARLR